MRLDVTLHSWGQVLGMSLQFGTTDNSTVDVSIENLRAVNPREVVIKLRRFCDQIEQHPKYGPKT